MSDRSAAGGAGGLAAGRGGAGSRAGAGGANTPGVDRAGAGNRGGAGGAGGDRHREPRHSERRRDPIGRHRATAVELEQLRWWVEWIQRRFPRLRRCECPRQQFTWGIEHGRRGGGGRGGGGGGTTTMSATTLRIAGCLGAATMLGILWVRGRRRTPSGEWIRSPIGAAAAVRDSGRSGSGARQCRGEVRRTDAENDSWF